MRIATALRGVHYVLHAPQGDTYADLLFTMIERRAQRPPVTYTTFQARDLGSDTAGLLQNAVREAYERFRPDALLVGASCTAELLQDDPAGLALALKLPIPVIPLELPAYQRKENWGASETFYRIVRTLCPRPASSSASASTPATVAAPAGDTPARRRRCNILGPTALGFRHRDDVREISTLLQELGVDINVVAPLDADVAALRRLPEADFNVVLYPEIARSAAEWLQQSHGQPWTRTIPIGVGATREFIAEVARLAQLSVPETLLSDRSRLGWYSHSVDSTYLTGKRVFIFGDATHAIAAARVAATELGFSVVGLGTYSRELAREVRAAAAQYGIEPLITDDYLEVEKCVSELRPELVLGTQMERHIAKRLSVPCAVISAPMHVQDFPARYAPQMGFEGANVLYDTWVQPLMMGLEEHLLTMFREDFEFHAGAAPSHLGATAMPDRSPQPDEDASAASDDGRKGGMADFSATQIETTAAPVLATGAAPETAPAPAAAAPAPAPAGTWTDDALRELNKIPFFVRSKARRNTERYAHERQIGQITIETLYEAKSHFAR
jgi:light-independent protochlorophyllide reductase subunit B